MARPLRSASGVVASRLVEVPVPAPLAGLATCTWEGRPDATTRTISVLPDGCVDLVWDGDRLTVTGAGTSVVRHEVTSTVVGVRLRSGSAGRVLGVPAHRIPVDGVELGALWGAAARQWQRRLRTAADDRETTRVLHALLGARSEDGGAPDGAVLSAVSVLAMRGVDEAVRRSGVSGRELRRRFRSEVGLGPKALQRVLRFRRFLGSLEGLAHGELSLAGLAAGLGYADQAHLTRECRALSGSTPTGLVRRWARHEPGRNVQDFSTVASTPSWT